MDTLAENQGELTPELEARMDEALQEIVSKQDGYIKVLDMLEASEAQARKWRDYMADRLRIIDNHKTRLKTALIQHLQRIGIREMQGELGKVRLMKTVKVGSVDEALLPAKYKQIIQETRIDKRRLLEDLKAGPVEGAEIEEVEYLKVL